MGEDFVANAVANASDFTRPIQDFITRNAWGDVWQRPGLDMKTRSLVTVAMLTPLDKQHELKGRGRSALHNGATRKKKCRKRCCTPASTAACRRRSRHFEARLKCSMGRKKGENPPFQAKSTCSPSNTSVSSYKKHSAWIVALFVTFALA
jgi:hypothetical protein